jgi:tetratricopeptide (TPR) repeat protein
VFRTWRFASLLLCALVLAGACARSPEARKARHLDRGDRYFLQEKYREAILEYRNALRIEGTDARATRQLGFAHYELGELGEALRYLQQAEKLEPSRTEVHLKLGHIYLLAGRTDEARAAAEAVLGRLPMNLDALILVVGAARTPEEITAVTHRLEGARSRLEHMAKFHLALAGLYLRAADVGSAERALLEAVAREPGSVDAHTALGNFYASGRDLAKAEQEYKVAANLTQPGAPARIRLADSYLSRGRREEARRILEELTREAPDYLPAWRQLASISFAEERIDDSLAALRRVLNKSPGDTEGRILRGRIHLAKGETVEAITEFQRLLRQEPRLAPAHYHLAVAHLQAGNLHQARSELREAINNAPSFAEAIQLLAQLNIQTGVVGAAIDDLEALIKSQPGAMGAYPLLSAAYLKQGDHARAFATARKLASVAPQDARGALRRAARPGGSGPRRVASSTRPWPWRQASSTRSSSWQISTWPRISLRRPSSGFSNRSHWLPRRGHIRPCWATSTCCGASHSWARRPCSRPSISPRICWTRISVWARSTPRHGATMRRSQSSVRRPR